MTSTPCAGAPFPTASWSARSSTMWFGYWPRGSPRDGAEAPLRAIELSAEVAAIREEIARRLPITKEQEVGVGGAPLGAGPPSTVIDWLQAECGLDRRGAEQAIAYVAAGRTILGAVPT